MVSLHDLSLRKCIVDDILNVDYFLNKLYSRKEAENQVFHFQNIKNLLNNRTDPYNFLYPFAFYSVRLDKSVLNVFFNMKFDVNPEIQAGIDTLFVYLRIINNIELTEENYKTLCLMCNVKHLSNAICMKSRLLADYIVSFRIISNHSYVVFDLIKCGWYDIFEELYSYVYNSIGYYSYNDINVFNYITRNVQNKIKYAMRSPDIIDRVMTSENIANIGSYHDIIEMLFFCNNEYVMSTMEKHIKIPRYVYEHHSLFM